jgi:hypothetical protein
MKSTFRITALRNALGALAMTFVSAAVATSAEAPPISTHCTAAEYRQFDFWLGDWDTFESDAPSGAVIARNRVEAIAQSCALQQLYEQTDGLIGHSILNYDRVRKQWKQTWVTNQAWTFVLWGNMKDGAMVLEGDVHFRDGRTVLQRITWQPKKDSVREFAERSKDGGKTWTPAFDVVFRKRTGSK